MAAYPRGIRHPEPREPHARAPDLNTRRGPNGSVLAWVMLDRIGVDPKVCDGKPTIRGMRITVDFVLKLLGDGYTADDIAREYPELEEEDVYQAAKYGAWLASERHAAIAR